MTTTSIEWTTNPDGTPGRSWNPIRGCSRVSPGCQRCYAETIARRFSGAGKPFHGLINDHGFWNGRIIQAPEKALLEPSTWRRASRVFVNSMTDVFHENCPEEWIDCIFAVMARFSQHTYIVLTKRADRMHEYLSDPERQYKIIAAGMQLPLCWMERLPNWPLPNVWVGVSVEDQQRANQRVPALLQTPAAVRFLSCEPLLGPIDLRRVQVAEHTYLDAVTGFHASEVHARSWNELMSRCTSGQLGIPPIPPNLPGLNWVIAGGESGTGARPMHPDWARGLRDQCVNAGVPFFFKQWGGWAPGQCAMHEQKRTEQTATWFNGKWHFNSQTPGYEGHVDDEPDLYLFGKKRSGRILDGRKWGEFPR